MNVRCPWNREYLSKPISLKSRSQSPATLSEVLQPPPWYCLLCLKWVHALQCTDGRPVWHTLVIKWHISLPGMLHFAHQRCFTAQIALFFYLNDFFLNFSSSNNWILNCTSQMIEFWLVCFSFCVAYWLGVFSSIDFFAFFSHTFTKTS